MPAGQLLRRFAAVILVANVIATVVAVVVNLPSQFGMTGTDAGDEFLTSGTAISAPPFPVALFLIVFFLGGRTDRWRGVGIVVAYLAAATVAIGGVGELVAEPTEDTPKSVLVGAGIVWVTIGGCLRRSRPQRPYDALGAARAPPERKPVVSGSSVRRVEIRDFESDDLPDAGRLLAARHAAHRRREPLLPTQYEDPAAAQAEVDALWSREGRRRRRRRGRARRSRPCSPPARCRRWRRCWRTWWRCWRTWWRRCRTTASRRSWPRTAGRSWVQPSPVPWSCPARTAGWPEWMAPPSSRSPPCDRPPPVAAGAALSGRWVLDAAHRAGAPAVISDWRSTNLLSSRAWTRLGYRETFWRMHRVVGF